MNGFILLFASIFFAASGTAPLGILVVVGADLFGGEAPETESKVEVEDETTIETEET